MLEALFLLQLAFCLRCILSLLSLCGLDLVAEKASSKGQVLALKYALSMSLAVTLTPVVLILCN